VNDALATLEIIHHYKNETEYPLEANFTFPQGPESVVSKMIITLGDKTIES